MEKVVVRDNLARMRAAGYFSILGILVMSILATLPLILIYLPTYGIQGLANMPILPQLIATFTAEVLVIVAALWWVGALKDWKETLFLRDFNLKKVGVGLAVGVAFFVGLFLLELLAKGLGAEVGNSDTAAMFAKLEGLEKYIVLFLGVAVLAPLIEELLFRGYILGFILRGNQAERRPLKSGIVVWAIVYSSFWFAILHFQGASSVIDFIVLGWTFLFACASSVLMLRFQSLYPSIAAHFIYNFASAVALLLL